MEVSVWLQAEGHRNRREQHRLDVMFGKGEWVRCWHQPEGWTAHVWDYHQRRPRPLRPLWESVRY